MGPRKLFLNDNGRLRSGWRIILFVLVFLAIYQIMSAVLWVAYLVATPLFTRVPYARYFQDLVFRSLLLCSALLAGYLCNRVVEGLPWRALGLVLHRKWFRDFFLGSVVGLVSLSLAVAVALAGHGFRFDFPNTAALFATSRTLISSALLFVVAALAEEALFRGYPLQTLCRAGLMWLALLLTSLPFAAVHLGNPNVVPFVTFTNTALAGIWLGVAYLRTRSLWFPLGVHWSWNWALGSIFGLPVSGLKLVSNPLLESVDLGPSWLTGGNYGIEGGAACTVALIISTVLIWRTRWISPDAELLRLTSQENPATPRRAISIVPADDRSANEQV